MTPLTTKDWKRVEAAFAKAIDMNGQQRQEFLAHLDHDEPRIGAEVRSMLDVRQNVGTFLEDSALTRIDPGMWDSETDPMRGRRIGPYVIVERIARGGMGQVYLADRADGQFRQHVAIKLIRPEVGGDEILFRFRNERQVLANLSHPNIAQLFDGGTTDDRLPYLVMEFVDGVRIDEYCDQHRLTLEQRIELFRTVCEAVQHAHQNLVVHRDLKPSNILVTEDGTVKLLDFGIARMLEPDSDAGSPDARTETVTGERRLTPAYASPEQIRHKPITTASDVYSLGVVLYELLTDQRPYDLKTGSEAELERAICEQPPSRPSTIVTKRTIDSPHNSHVSDTTAPSTPGAIAANRNTDPARLRRQLRGDLETIILTALAKEPKRRYGSVQQMSDDLGRFLRSEPIIARPPSAFYQFRKFIERNALFAGAAATIVLALIVAIVGTSAGMIQAIAAGREAEAQQARAEASEQRAIEEAERALAAEAEAQQRAEELEKIAQFQASHLAGIDATLMGVALRSAVLDRRRSTLESAGLDEAAIEPGLRELERSLSGVNFTDIALEAMDETIFARALDAIDDQFDNQPLVKARLLQTVAETLRELGLLDAAMLPQEEAVRIRQNELGDMHEDTLASTAHMGLLLRNLGRLAEAEPYFHEALEKSRRSLGDEHPLTLASINNMGFLLQSQGRYDEAEHYYRKALEKRRQVLGDEHTQTVASIASLGSLLNRQGRLSEAEKYYREALDKRRRVLGENHPQTLRSMNNMGGLLSQLGRLDEASKLYRETLDRRRRVLGNMHPETLSTINNLGLLLHRQGKLDQAEPYYREALEAFRRTLGDEHPETLIAINNMGSLLWYQGQFEQAASYFSEVLEAQRRILGEDHQNTINSMSNVGAVMRDLGELEDAERYGSEAVKRAQAVLPAGHWQTGIFLSQHARTLIALHRFAEAEARLLEAHTILESALGPHHQRTISIAEHVADLYDAWHQAVPHSGHDVRAAVWRTMLPAEDDLDSK